MLQRTLCLLILSLSASVMLRGAAPEENVVVSSATEEYVFVPPVGGSSPQVRHSSKIEYLATRHSATVTPHVFHSNIIRLDKASGGKAQYRNANSPTVFHDDSKVCFFDLRLDAKDKKAKAQFKRTFTDGAHFTSCFLMEDYPLRSKTLVFEIPASFPTLELIDRNFPPEGISREESKSPAGSRRIVYTVSNLPELPSDPSSPSALASLPQILVKGYFPDTDSLYRYHRPMLEVDTVIPGVAAIMSGILEGARSRDEIVGRVYRYVQQNVRYVAFEEGEAAYRPDTPAEVIRKRYGDCKGMSLLLATLLRRAGIDARVAAVGTSKIPFRIAVCPSLSATNHMICLVPEGDGYLFLDPTNEQISHRHIPAAILGKDAMLFIPGSYLLVDIPTASPRPSEDILTYRYGLASDALYGVASRRCSEDMAESFVARFSDVPSHMLSDLLARSLVPSGKASVPTDSVVYDRSTQGLVTVTAPIRNSAAVIEADGIIYLDLNTSGEPFTSRVDTTDRHSDYRLPLSARIERHAEVTLPKVSGVTLPDDYEASLPYATFSCRFSRSGSTVSMTKTMNLKSSTVPLADIPAWNRAISDWNAACNRQIEVKL